MSTFTKLLEENPLRLAALITLAYHLTYFLSHLGFSVTNIMAYAYYNNNKWNGNNFILELKMNIYLNILSCITHLICTIVLISTIILSKALILLLWVILFTLSIAARIGINITIAISVNEWFLCNLPVFMFEIVLLLIMTLYYVQLKYGRFIPRERNFIPDYTTLELNS